MSHAPRPPLLPDVGVLAMPYHRWRHTWMTPHHVLPRLAAYFHVVWLEPPRHWREIGAANGASKPSGPERPAPGFVHHVPPPWLPEIYRPAWLNHMLFRMRVRSAWRRLARLGVRTRVLHLWHPQFERALDVRPYDLAMYHVDDEYAFTADAPPIGIEEQRVLQRVDQVFAISPRLMERKAGVNPHMAFAPEGVDFHAYATPVAEPDDLAAVPHPRIGYTGNLKLQLDWRLLRDLARRHPGWSFVFVGPRKPMPPADDALVDELMTLPNVHFLGAKSVTALAAYPQHFDVCVMPYVVDGYTDNIYPLKLHEYLASGTPVVGSPIRTLQDFRKTVLLASGLGEWSAALASALVRGRGAPSAVAARQATARRYDWSEIIYRIAATTCMRLGPHYLSRLEGADIKREESAPAGRALARAMEGTR